MVFRSKLTIWCIFIDKYLGGGWSAVALIRVLWIVGLSLVAWHWIYLVVALALLSVAFVLFGMKCYLCMRGVWLLLEE